MRLGAGFNKLVSFAIVWCMVISSFLGILLVAIPQVGVTAQGEIPDADMIVGTGYSRNLIVHNQGAYTFDGNLTIRAGGIVEIKNSTLLFRSSYSGAIPVGSGVKALSVTVEDGGILILDNSTLTTDIQSGNPIPALGVVVRHGGYFESRTSQIAFSGHLLVDDAKFSLIDSVVSGVAPVFNSTYFPNKVFRSSPVMLFMSSDVTMIGSKIIDMYDNGSVNTVPLTIYNNNYQFAQDTSSRQFVDYFLERDVNAVFGAGSTVTGIPLSMTMDDTKNVTVQQTQRLYTTGFDMGGLEFEAANIQSITLHVSYITDTTFSTGGLPNAVYYTPLFGSVTPTTITITPNYQASDPSGTNVNVTKDFVLPNMSAQNLGKLALNFTNQRNSNVYIDRIWVTIDMRLSTYRNLTIGGSTNLVAADSYIQLNSIDENAGTNATKGAYHKLVALDQSIANLYGLTVQNSSGGFLGTNIFKTSNRAVVLRPDTTGPLDTTTGNTQSRLQTIDAVYYTVGAGQVMQVSHFNTGDSNGLIVNASINLRYRTAVSYANGGYVAYSFDGVRYTNTNILIVDRSGGDLTVSFSIPGKHTLADLSNLRIRYDNTASAQIAYFDAIWLDIRSEPTVGLYRWMNLNVTDYQQIPVGDVGVTSYINGTDTIAYYLDQSGVATAPPQAILDYLGKTATTFNRTGPSGFVKIPLLSDVLNSSNFRNGKAFDYNQVFKYRNAGGLYLLNSADLGISTRFSHFPAMIVNADSRNVTFPTLSAMPELNLPFWASTYNPARGVLVNLTANVTNNGVVTAYDVLVRFRDTTTNGIIADRTIASIAPGEQSVITVQWTASYPVGLHTLNVTVDPFGALPQLNRSNTWNQTNVVVQGVADLSITAGQISLFPAIVVTNSTVSIRADIVNAGDNMEQTAVVSFYDVFNGDMVLIGNFTMPAIRSGQTGVAIMTWSNMLPGDHNITIVIDENNTLMEASKGNNQAGRAVTVLDYPDLVATNLQFKLTNSGSVVTQVFIGDSVTLTATVMNTGESVASNFLVRFWLGTTSTGTMIGDVVVPSLAAGATADIQTPWISTVIQESGRNQSRLITVEVNPFTHGNDTPIKETNYDNNIVANALLVIDNRVDLYYPTEVSVRPSGSTNSTSSAVFGQTIDITFTMANQGMKPANGAVLNIYAKDIDNYNYLLMTTTKDLIGGGSVQVSFPWVVNVTAGVYSLVVEVNSRHVIEESNYTNNIDARNFTVNVPNPLIVISAGGKTDFLPGESIYVYGAITNADGNFALANQSITLRLLDAGGLPVGQAVSAKTDFNGAYSGYVFVPTDRSGSHSVSVTLNTGAVYSSALPINIVEIFKPQSIPFWIFILIAVIVIAVILIFSVYLYKYGLGKMVECGECGALIPESSKRCPRCATEFETDTAKCSECGTWIPAKSKECPECGAKFMTEPVEEISEDDYMASMRRQYEEYVNGFREQAKAALGKKYSEEKFMDWLKTEPAYMPFEAWVAKQEEDRKIGSMACPSCGTLNPKGSTICSKCGTVFDRVLDMTPAGEQKTFRKIVKRSSDRKTVSKKAAQDPAEHFVEQAPPEEPKKE